MRSTFTLKPSGYSCVFSFPYWILVETSEQLKIKEISLENTKIRVYPYFRSGIANFAPTPNIDPHKIPFLEGAKPKIDISFKLDNLVVMPIYKDGKMLGNEVISSEVFRDNMTVAPLDSVRIDIFDRDEDRVVNIARNILNNLIQLTRVNTGQWWIEHISNNDFLKCTFPILRNGYGLEQPTIYGSLNYSVGNYEPTSVNQEIWENIIGKLNSGEIASIYRLFLLDAKYYSISRDFRRAILDATIACEQARDVHFERLFTANNPEKKFKSGKIYSNNNLPTHLNEDLLKLTNGKYSYQKSEPLNFEVMQDLWNARGNIAHGRAVQYFKNGVLHKIDKNNTHNFIETANHCVSWLESLNP